MGKRPVPAWLGLIGTGLCLIGCARQVYVKGQYFPHLALEEGRGGWTIGEIGKLLVPDTEKEE